MRLKKKGQVRAFFWVLFAIASLVVIGYLVFKWSEIADYLSSLFLS